MLLSKVDFAVNEFDPMFSDIHCGIEFSLKIACTATVPPLAKRSPDTIGNSTEQGYIWDSAKKQELVNNINMQQVNTLREEIENNNFVNNIVETINIWQSSAKSSFRKRTRNCPAHDNGNNNNNSNNYFYEHELRFLLNINKSKCHIIPVPMQNMFDHFKSLNITPDVDDDIALSSCAAYNPDLDQHFSKAEIRRVVKKLKNNKACGPDFVLNEFIESTLD